MAGSPRRSTISHKGECADWAQGGKLVAGKALVVIQVALSQVLVACAGLLLVTFLRLETLDPGFEPAHVLLMDVDLGKRAPSPAKRGAIFSGLLDHLHTLPRVRSVSTSANTPLGGVVDTSYLQIEDGVFENKEHELVFKNEVGEQYFETLGMHLLAGRDFSSRDTPNSPTVAIVNESFAKKYFQGQSAVGRRSREEQGNKLSDPVEIVGMVRDAKYLDLREDFHPTVYIATSQKANRGRAVTVELRITGNATTVIREAKRAAEAVAPEASLQFKTLAEQVDGSLARERLLAVLSGFFGGLALLLALIGLYGVTSYNVTQRRKEIGISR